MVELTIKKLGFFQKYVLKRKEKKDQTNRKKNLRLEPLEKKYSDLIEELSVKVKSSSFLRNTFGLTWTKK